MGDCWWVIKRERKGGNQRKETKPQPERQKKMCAEKVIAITDKESSTTIRSMIGRGNIIRAHIQIIPIKKGAGLKLTGERINRVAAN